MLAEIIMEEQRMERYNQKTAAIETIAKVGHFVVERLRGGAWAELAETVDVNGQTV